MGVAMGEKGVIEDMRYKVHGVFDWKVKGVEAFMQTRTPEKDWGKYWTQAMMGAKDDRFKKGQISFAYKALIRGIIRRQAVQSD